MPDDEVKVASADVWLKTMVEVFEAKLPVLVKTGLVVPVKVVVAVRP